VEKTEQKRENYQVQYADRGFSGLLNDGRMEKEEEGGGKGKGKIKRKGWEKKEKEKGKWGERTVKRGEKESQAYYASWLEATEGALLSHRKIHHDM